jgi:type VI secretion system secreted protein VgrG
MSDYTQAGRLIRIDTALGTDHLLLDSFEGSEGISQLFVYRLELLSHDRDIDPNALLRKPATISIRLEDGEERHIHGLMSRFSQGGQVEAGEGDVLTAYSAEVVPWLWFLSLSTDCRIFQDKTVLEIVEEVFRDQGWSDFAIRCAGTYPTRDFCVQYRETHLAFISRLLEEEGIFYFFEHSDDAHTLVLADTNGATGPCPHKERALVRQEAMVEADVVTALRSDFSVRAGKVTLRDFNYLSPSEPLEIELSGEKEQEVYDYHPGRFATIEGGERYARLKLESLETERHLVTGDGTCRAFQSGFWFELAEHYSPRFDGKYILVSVRHTARSGAYRLEAVDHGAEYRNQFTATLHDVPYRPPHRHPKAVVRGTQTATVVGPAGEEVWTDRLGRVKLHFHWDRDGERDENSSCWVRVATPWGSKGFGSLSLPRIGDEVVVDFLEGDPDRPIIVGSVYNAQRMPPFELPAHQTQAGLRSHSIKGGLSNYSEILFEDKPGEEKLIIRAERDHHVVVEHNEFHTVQNTALFDFGGVKIKIGNLAVGGGRGHGPGGAPGGGNQGGADTDGDGGSGGYDSDDSGAGYGDSDDGPKGPKKQREYSGGEDSKYNGYDADYGDLYRATAITYEADYRYVKGRYGSYDASYDVYFGRYGSYLGLYGNYIGLYRMYTGVYGTYNSFYGLHLAHYLLYYAFYGAYLTTVGFYFGQHKLKLEKSVFGIVV